LGSFATTGSRDEVLSQNNLLAILMLIAVGIKGGGTTEGFSRAVYLSEDVLFSHAEGGFNFSIFKPGRSTRHSGSWTGRVSLA